MHLVNNCLQFIQSRLWPGHCVLCGAQTRAWLDLCRGCRDDLPLLPHACRRCAHPLPAGAGPECGQCQKLPPWYDSAHCPFVYGAPLDWLVIGLKFHGRLENARILGHLLADSLATPSRAAPESIIPVPLHPRRLRERGFNQAVELARPVAARLGIPVDTRTCRRILETRQQSVLTAPERRRNLRGAFTMRAPCSRSHVALLDDVMSTGHTLNELARTLKHAGVERVEVWSVARATRNGA
ncbi:MAG: ComF family protein [Pseudomonadota bacterium]|nr:MAG: ComF family protein [Pseudomonadota bacterium]